MRPRLCAVTTCTGAQHISPQPSESCVAGPQAAAPLLALQTEASPTYMHAVMRSVAPNPDPCRHECIGIRHMYFKAAVMPYGVKGSETDWLSCQASNQMKVKEDSDKAPNGDGLECTDRLPIAFFQSVNTRPAEKRMAEFLARSCPPAGPLSLFEQKPEEARQTPVLLAPHFST